MNKSGSVREEESGLKVRGLMYAAINGWITEKFDESRFQHFKQTLPRDFIELFDNLDIKEWYPAEDVYRAYEYLIKYFENQMSQSELIASIVGYMFRQSITGFMKGMMAFLTPSTLIKRATTFWRRVHSAGEIEIERSSKNHLLVTLHGWKIHKISCKIFAGWMVELMRLTGSKNIKVKETHCALEGNEVCCWEAGFD